MNSYLKFKLCVCIFSDYTSFYSLERDLPARYDQMGVEIRERIKWDVREAMVGAENFLPKHAVIVTWKNVSFVGGYNALETVRERQHCIDRYTSLSVNKKN